MLTGHILRHIIIYLLFTLRKTTLRMQPKEVELAIKFNPNNAEAYNNLGTILGRKGDLKNAITAWKKALHLNSNITTARENIERAKSMLESKPHKTVSFPHVSPVFTGTSLAEIQYL